MWGPPSLKITHRIQSLLPHLHHMVELDMLVGYGPPALPILAALLSELLQLNLNLMVAEVGGGQQCAQHPERAGQQKRGVGWRRKGGRRWGRMSSMRMACPGGVMHGKYGMIIIDGVSWG